MIFLKLLITRDKLITISNAKNNLSRCQVPNYRMDLHVKRALIYMN